MPRGPSSADYLSEDLIGHIISYLSSPADLSAVSLVNKQWYAADAATRRSIKVTYCFAVSPARLTRRFHALKSVTLVGRPAGFTPSRTSDYFSQWIESLAGSSYAGGLEELKFKRFVLSHRLLLLIAQSFPNLKSLAFFECSGVVSSGLASILTSCTLLRALEVNGCDCTSPDDPWSSCFHDISESLESLIFVNSKMLRVDETAIERLVSRCRNLKCLKFDQDLWPDVFARILEAAPQLVDLGFGLLFSLPHGHIRTRVSNALISCTSVQSLSGNMVPADLCLLTPLCSKLLFLDLTRVFQNSGKIADFIEECHNLQRLWVHISVGDDILRSVGKACKNLQELKVVTQAVTEAGLASLAEGCHMLQSVTFVCSSVSNAALLTFAQKNPDIRRFKLVIQGVRHSSSLDVGVGFIFQHCKKLIKLSIHNAYVTDQVFFLAGVFGAQLKELSAPLLGESNGGIFYALNLCPNLRRLKIRGTSMGKAPFGDDALLAAAEAFKSLQFVGVGSSKITLKGCRTLKEMNPTLSVDFMEQPFVRFGLRKKDPVKGSRTSKELNARLSVDIIKTESQDVALDKVVVRDLLIYHRLD